MKFTTKTSSHEDFRNKSFGRAFFANAACVSVRRCALVFLLFAPMCLCALVVKNSAEGAAERATLLVIPVGDGRVEIAAASLDYAPKALSLIRSLKDGTAPVVVAATLDAPVFDTPQSGACYVYWLQAQGGKVLVKAGLDLSVCRQLRFVGGTAKRGLFEIIETTGEVKPLVTAAGDMIGGFRLAADGSVEEMKTSAKLDSVVLVDWRERAPATRPLTDSSGAVVKGLDSKALTLRVDVASGEAKKRFVATVTLGSTTRLLAEGEAVELR